MSRKSVKRGIKKYTAFVPKTARAASQLGRRVVSSAAYVLNRTVRVVRGTAKAVDRTTAKAIRSLSLKQKKQKKTHKKRKTQKKH